MAAELVDFIYKWKEIAGAIIGGFFSLAVALVVARDARTREERSAATLLIVTFTNFLARHASLTDLEKKQAIPAQDRHKWLSEKLAKSGPTLSPLTEAALARLLPIEPAIAVHLELFRTINGELERHTERISQDYRDFHERGKALRSTDVMEADAKIVVNAFDAAAKHAECAAHLLEKLVLSHVPTWNYIRMRLFPTQQDRVCLCLRNGIDAQPCAPGDAPQAARP